MSQGGISSITASGIAVTSVSGTANRITSTGGTTPVIDIAATYVGQASITTLGTITTGTWNATAVTVPYGGTGLTTATAYAVLCGGTTATGPFQSIASVGTANQLLASNGAAALPTFKSLSIVHQAFTANGTYTPTSGMVYCIIECVGGGGASGGAPATGATQVSCGSGGAGGEYARGVYSAATIGASQTVTIGAGGTGASGTTGGNGGTTSVGAVITAAGGTGGAVAGPAAAISSGYVAGGTGGSGGDLYIPGGIGQGSSASFGTFFFPGDGGSTPFGMGPSGEAGAASSGIAGTGYGSGPSGQVNNQSTAAQTGVNGKAGYVLVTEFVIA